MRQKARAVFISEKAVYFRCDAALEREIDMAREALEKAAGVKINQSEVVRALLRRGLDSLAAGKT